MLKCDPLTARLELARRDCHFAWNSTFSTARPTTGRSERSVKEYMPAPQNGAIAALKCGQAG
jgi:hypothetical protein